ncbi:hypothetical protein AY600_00810 [Phormidium willei BDU 130791]|nr:hypothetical protein AY600_00810 [Phormidium willei BDU 130791]
MWRGGGGGGGEVAARRGAERRAGVGHAALPGLRAGDVAGRRAARLGGKPVMLGLFSLEVLALAALSQAEGALALPAALVAVTLMFAGIPITGWLLGHYVAAAWRARAFAVEYLLALGVGAAVVPAMAALHLAGQGFDRQYLAFAAAAAVVAVGALCLPRPEAGGGPRRAGGRRAVRPPAGSDAACHPEWHRPRG